jgi:hypothetical protein
MAAPAAMNIPKIERMIEDYLVGPEAGGDRKLPDMDDIAELRQYIGEYISNSIEKKEHDRIAKVLILQGLFYKNIIAEAASGYKDYLKEMARVCQAISTKAISINGALEEAAGIEATLGGKRSSSKRRRVTFKKRKH